MKHISIISLILIATVFSSLAKDNDPILLKIGKTEVPKSQFLFSLTKNNNLLDLSNEVDSENNIKEYLDLYINMKLKVEGAKKRGIDTTSTFKSDLASSRSSLARSYMSNDYIIEQVARESYIRSMQNLEVSHILVKLPSRSLPSDTLEAWDRTMSIRNRITDEGEAFDDVAYEVSDDPYAKMTEKGGYLGWYSTQIFVEPFEDAMYSLKEREISYPIRSSFGYHLIKLHSKSPNIGAITAAQIFLTGQEGLKQSNDNKLKQHADDIYQRLVDGEDFAELSAIYSNDESTANKGGVIGVVGLDSRIIPEIKNSLFALQSVGDFSKPVKSPYGYHILKIMDATPPKGWEDSKNDLCDAVKKGYRRSSMDEKQFKFLSQSVGYNLNKQLYQEMINVATNFCPYSKKFSDHFQLKKDSVLLTIGEEQFTLGSFLQVFERAELNQVTMSTDIINDKLRSFSLMHLAKREDATLEKRVPEFRFLVNEFYDGLLLFDFMNIEVWDRASTDIEDKDMFLKKNIKRYSWDKPRFCGSVVLCKDKHSLEKVSKTFPCDKYAKKADIINAFVTDSLVFIDIEDSAWIKGENDFIDYKIFGSEIMPATTNNYPFYYIVGEMSKCPLTYSHADVYKIDLDYQDYLEKRLMKKLRKEFKVKVDKKVLNSIIAEYKR